jgi:hypothetical protein
MMTQRPLLAGTTTDGNELTTARVARKLDAGCRGCRFPNSTPCIPVAYQNELENDF